MNEIERIIFQVGDRFRLFSNGVDIDKKLKENVTTPLKLTVKDALLHELNTRLAKLRSQKVMTDRGMPISAQQSYRNSIIIGGSNGCSPSANVKSKMNKTYREEPTMSRTNATALETNRNPYSLLTSGVQGEPSFICTFND